MWLIVHFIVCCYSLPKTKEDERWIAMAQRIHSFKFSIEIRLLAHRSIGSNALRVSSPSQRHIFISRSFFVCFYGLCIAFLCTVSQILHWISSSFLLVLIIALCLAFFFCSFLKQNDWKNFNQLPRESSEDDVFFRAGIDLFVLICFVRAWNKR